MSALLTEEECNRCAQFLKMNIDAFAWRHLDMLGIDPIVAYSRNDMLPFLDVFFEYN